MTYAGNLLGGKYNYPRDWDRDWTTRKDSPQNATACPVESQDGEPEVVYCSGCGRALGGDLWFFRPTMRSGTGRVYTEKQEHICGTTEGERIE